MSKTAVIAGATGAVGRALLPLLLQAPDYRELRALARRPLPVSDPRLTVLPADFDQLDALGDALAVDDVYCCLGTTQAKDGQAGLERVDHDYVLALARACLARGARQFLVVSAIGASERSLSFYSRVKGRMERALSQLPYPAIHIVRPSLLMAEREERRLVEDLGRRISPLLRPLFLGPARRYRPVAVEEVAGALLQLSRQPYAGVRVHYLPLSG